MHLIVCLDERDGMSFCGRRLSRDREVTAHILKLTQGKNLWMAPDSARLFPEGTAISEEAFLQKAALGDYCFAEIGPLPEVLEDLESVTVYHWNRSYPSTVQFPRSLLNAMRLEYTEEFPGNSHDLITVERFCL